MEGEKSLMGLRRRIDLFDSQESGKQKSFSREKLTVENIVAI